MIARRLGRAIAGGVLGLMVAAYASAPARAQRPQTITHKVQPGDTLQLLAAEYYGDRRHAVFIMVENDLSHPRPLRKNERIRIPVERQITAGVGDTLAVLAAEYMGDAGRAPFLAEFNNLPSDASITAGQRIVIPFHVRHRAASNETLASIAAAYFGDSRKAKLIKEYNFIDKDSLRPGETVVIPIHHVRVQASKLPPPDAKSAAREDKRRDMQGRASRGLPVAQAAWRAGDYAAVKRELTQLDLDYLEQPVAVEVGVLLGAAYVAFDDADSAYALFQKVLERKPQHAIRAYDYSPKVRRVWERAGGEVDTSRAPHP